MVGKARGVAEINLAQVIARIPRVAVRSIAGHIAIQVVEEVRRAPLRELVVRLVR